MAIQQWTMMKIGGSQSRALFDKVSAWSKMERDGEDFPTGMTAEIHQFVTTLRGRAKSLPTLFFCEYIDMWSVAASPVHEFLCGPKREQANILTQGDYLVAAYPLPDANRLKRRLSKALRKPNIRSRAPQEDRWFIFKLLEAVHAWEKLIPDATILIFRRSWAPSPDDAEVKAACT